MNRKDPINVAVYEKMSAKGKGFFIIRCGPYIHPANKVPNCYAISFDGFPQYKFEATMQGLRVAEVRDRYYLDIPCEIDEVLSQDELVKRINAAPVTDQEREFVERQHRFETTYVPKIPT